MGWAQNLAMNALTGGKKPQNQSGLGGLASSFLGGSGSHGGGSSSGGGGLSHIAGQIVGSLFSDGKPNNQQQQQQQQQSSHQSDGYGGSSSGGQGGGGGGGGLMDFLGGHHGSVSTVDL